MGNLNCTNNDTTTIDKKTPTNVSHVPSSSSSSSSEGANNNDNNTPSSSSSSRLTSNLNSNSNPPSTSNVQNNDDDNDKINDEVMESTKSIPSSIKGDDFCIPIKIYKPIIGSKKKKKKARAVIFFIHGGIFSQGDRNSHPTIAQNLVSSLNAIVVTASFRNGEEAPFHTNVTMTDLMDVSDFCREEFCSKENDDDVPFGLVGSSSGGFFALTLSQQQNQSDRIQFCIPICPVANPYKRAAYLRSSITNDIAILNEYTSDPHDPIKSKFILEKQLSFWKDDTCMIQAGEALKENVNNVPTLLILGSRDKNVPLDVTKDVQSWATRTVVIGGRGHELCDKIDDLVGGYQCYLPDIERFLEHCL